MEQVDHKNDEQAVWSDEGYEACQEERHILNQKKQDNREAHRDYIAHRTAAECPHRCLAGRHPKLAVQKDPGLQKANEYEGQIEEKHPPADMVSGH